MSEKETQCRQLYNKDTNFNENKKLAYLFSSKIFVKKLCDYLDDLGLISIEARGKGIKNDLIGNLIWATSGIYPILLDLSDKDRLDTDKWKDLIKSINKYSVALKIQDYKNIIETVYNFKG